MSVVLMLCDNLDISWFFFSLGSKKLFFSLGLKITTFAPQRTYWKQLFSKQYDENVFTILIFHMPIGTIYKKVYNVTYNMSACQIVFTSGHVTRNLQFSNN